MKPYLKQDADLKDESYKSEFNAALEHLKIISEIKRALASIITAEECFATYKNYFRILKAYYMALIGIMKDQDDEAMRKELNKVKTQYEKLQDLERLGKNNVPREIIDSFENFEYTLRNKEQEYDLCLPKKKDARFALAH